MFCVSIFLFVFDIIISRYICRAVRELPMNQMCEHFQIWVKVGVTQVGKPFSLFSLIFEFWRFLKLKAARTLHPNKVVRFLVYEFSIYTKSFL